MKTVLLIDGDIFVFKTLIVTLQETHFEPDNSCEFILQLVNFTEAESLIHERIKVVKNALNADEVVFCYSDHRDNWRTDVLPTYKHNRKKWETLRPPGLVSMKERIAKQYESYMRPRMEADDCMGILATWRKFKPDCRKIIVSEDKDMLTVPAWIFNPAKDVEPYQITRQQADITHLAMTLSGDQTDGYSGCPGVGTKQATESLEGGLKYEKYEHEFKTGKRKGESEERWRQVQEDDLWKVVVSHYERAGLTEDDALVQARVARICRASDFDFKNKKVKLWTPNLI